MADGEYLRRFRSNGPEVTPVVTSLPIAFRDYPTERISERCWTRNDTHGPFIVGYRIDSRRDHVTSRERHPAVLIDAPAELRFVVSKELLEAPVYSVFPATHPRFLYARRASSE